MKSKIFLFSLLITLLFTSCGKHSAEYKALKAQNDSLLLEKANMEKEMDEYFSSINQIYENLEKIKSTENAITLNNTREISEDTRIKINEDINYLNNLLQNNKDELVQLKSKLKKSSLKLTELEKTIARLTEELEKESTQIALLQNQLAQKDTVITQLSTTIGQMGENIESLSQENKSKEEKIKELDASLHSAWYAFGTKKELIQQKILTTNGIFRKADILKSDFNKDYFVRIDARNVKAIPLYSKTAKILTTHPKSSYMLEKQDDNLVLIISDPSAFWSVSKYLVVQTD